MSRQWRQVAQLAHTKKANTRTETSAKSAFDDEAAVHRESGVIPAGSATLDSVRNARALLPMIHRFVERNSGDSRMNAWRGIAERETYQQWGEQWRRAGDVDCSERAFLESIRIKERQFGDDHPVVGFTLLELAALYAEENRVDDAVNIFERAMTLFKLAPAKHL